MKIKVLNTCISLLVFLCIPLPEARANINIFAIKSGSLPAYDMALEGVREVLAGQAKVEEFNLSGDENGWKNVYDRIREKRPRIIITFGTFATLLAKKDVMDIPIVFCTVLNPKESGIVASFNSPGPRISGASLDIPIDLQFEYIQKVYPGTRRIGVLYNPEETGAIIEQARAAALRKGLSLLAVPLKDERELPMNISRLLNRIDFLWGVADSTVFSVPATQQIIVETLNSGVPFMGISPSFVKAGALFSLHWDDKDVGRQAGEIVLKFLNGTGDMISVPVSTPRKVGIAVNMRTAKMVGIKFSEALLKDAEVYK